MIRLEKLDSEGANKLVAYHANKYLENKLVAYIAECTNTTTLSLLKVPPTVYIKNIISHVTEDYSVRLGYRQNMLDFRMRISPLRNLPSHTGFYICLKLPGINDIALWGAITIRTCVYDEQPEYIPLSYGTVMLSCTDTENNNTTIATERTIRGRFFTTKYGSVPVERVSIKLNSFYPYRIFGSPDYIDFMPTILQYMPIYYPIEQHGSVFNVVYKGILARHLSKNREYLVDAMNKNTSMKDIIKYMKKDILRARDQLKHYMPIIESLSNRGWNRVNRLEHFVPLRPGT